MMVTFLTEGPPWLLALLDAGATVLIAASCWMVACREYLHRRHGSEEMQR